MSRFHPDSTDAKNAFNDLSGVDSSSYTNPYDALLEACHDDPAQLQVRYDTHRTTRNAQQRAKLLAPDFSGLIIDPILKKLEDPTIEPGYVDPRNCLVFWARPPAHIRNLVTQIQAKLLKLAPHLWLMPVERGHLTAFEVTHSLTLPEIEAIIKQIDPVIEKLTDYPYTHRSRLIKPLISYDSAAIALSFLPAAGEVLPRDEPRADGRKAADDKYSYHHFRRDLFGASLATGIKIEQRYVVPSAHTTVGRFLVQEDHDTKEKMERWLNGIDEINAWLQAEYWPKEGQTEPIKAGGEWIVGQEKGLDLRKGRLWYGGGETVRLGKGF